MKISIQISIVKIDDIQIYVKKKLSNNTNQNQNDNENMHQNFESMDICNVNIGFE